MTVLKEPDVHTTEFTQSKAYQKLKTLAKTPYDLTKEGNLTPQRIAKFTAESCGYKLLYGTERINEDTMHALLDLAHETKALDKMDKMQSGEILNFIQGYPSENRSVLHTAARDFFDNPNKGKTAAEAAQIAKKEAEKLRLFMAKIDKENKYQDMIVIGIGGSELGPKAHYEALLHLLKPGRAVHFIGNIDPDNAAMVARKVNLKKALVLVISKTGSTLETVTNEDILRNHFKQAGLKSDEHFIAITGEGSPLDNPQKYLEVFHMWDWIGGRFCTTSMAGGVLLAFAFGFDVFWEMLRGANAMDKAALTKDLNKNLPLLGALLGIWNRDFLGHPVLAIVPYSYGLARFPSHIQQLDMESNGKHIDQHGTIVDFETGPIIFGEPGTNAQHSFYQLIHQGTTVVALEMIGYKQSQTNQDLSLNGTTSQEKLLSNLFAQSIALATGQKNENPNKDFQGNRPSHILLGKQLTPFALGALLAYFEHKIAFQGFIWHINSFDQEGVQLGKVLATKIINRFAAHSGQAKGGAQPYPLGDAFLKHLETL